MNNPRHNIREVCAAARHRAQRQILADRSAAADADEQPRPRSRREPDELVVYGGIGRAARDWDELRPHRRDAEDAGRRRDAAGPVRQAGRRLPHPRRRAARADRQLQPGAALGDLGAFQRARSQGADDVRPDDRRLVDLHRHAGHRAGHLRDLRRGGPPALWRRPHGQLDPDRRPRRHGRRAAAGRRHGRRLLPRRRMQPELASIAPAHPLSRRAGRRPRRGAGDDRALDRGRRGEVGRPARQRRRDLARARPARRAAGHRHRPDLRARSGQRLPAAGLDASSEWREKRERDPKAVEQAARASMACTSRRCSTSGKPGIPTFDYGNNIRQMAQGRGRRRTPSTSPASCRPISVRCSAAASARSAGRRCRAIRRTSTRPTPR